MKTGQRSDLSAEIRSLLDTMSSGLDGAKNAVNNAAMVNTSAATDALDHVTEIQRCKAEPTAQFKTDFFVYLLKCIVDEASRLLLDADQYLAYLDGKTLLDRVRQADFSGSADEVYAKVNAPTSPVRNGMLLYGLYVRARGARCRKCGVTQCTADGELTFVGDDLCEDCADARDLAKIARQDAIAEGEATDDNDD